MNRKIVTVLVMVLLLLLGLSIALFTLPSAREGTPVIPTDGTTQTEGASGSAEAADPTDGAGATDTVEATGEKTDDQETDVDVQQGVTDREDFEEPDPTKPATGDEKPAVQTDPVQMPPDESAPDGTQPVVPEDPKNMTFAMYEAMSEEDQEKFVESFDSVSDFVDWWNQAKKEEDRQDPIEIEDGKIDLGNLP